MCVIHIMNVSRAIEQTLYISQWPDFVIFLTVVTIIYTTPNVYTTYMYVCANKEWDFHIDSDLSSV